MKAHVIRKFGSPDVFETTELPRPSIQPGHVLIRVKATSVNPIDTKIRSGMVTNIAPDFPAILHGDVAGIVEEVGEGVTHLKVGDEVYACAGGVKNTPGGALAEYMLADAAVVAKKPSSLTFAEAAALPIVGITAWEGLVDRARIQPGQNVLIHGGAGGVGHIAIQIAKLFGANVYTTVSTEQKAELVKELGAQPILYPNTTVEEYVNTYTDGKGFDLVFDTVGKENLDRSFHAVKPKGQVVAIAARSTHDLTPLHNKGISLHVVFMILPLITGEGKERHREILEELKKHIEDGKIRPILDKNIFTFDEVKEAHQYLESGKAIGKVALVQSNS